MMSVNVNVAGTGFAVLDRIYATDEKPLQALGGSCGNVLVSLAMLARSVAPILALGADQVGDDLVSEFAQAGADIRYIFRRTGVGSPVLAQKLDVQSGQHTFSFICPETAKPYPRYRPIAPDEVHKAEPVLNGCSVFYTDRISDGILEAMETAANAGAVIYFEPSGVQDQELFIRALALATIVKYSSDRLGDLGGADRLRSGAIAIMTRGADGLDVSQNGRTVWCAAKPAPVVRDTCGSGDMVTIGLIDWILTSYSRHSMPQIDDILDGIVAGQRLAAANCAFTGARGLFKQHGARVVRRLLDDDAYTIDLQMDLFGEPPTLRRTETAESHSALRVGQ
jgi:fructokinase